MSLRYYGFEGDAPLIINTNTSGKAYYFLFTQKAALTDKNGTLAPGVDISSVVVTVHLRNDARTAVADLIDAPAVSVTDNNVKVHLKAPSATGYYTLLFVYTGSDGSVDSEEFVRIQVK